MATPKSKFLSLVSDVPILPIGFTLRFFAFRGYVVGFSTNHEGDFVYCGGGLNYAWIDK